MYNMCILNVKIIGHTHTVSVYHYGSVRSSIQVV